jgi:hypothetical protein
MNVKIREVSVDELKEAVIKEGERKELPSMHDDWRFNFASQLKKLPNAKAYVLVMVETPEIIEGCMIFQWQNNITPYMPFIETAPHNQTESKKHDDVAGCLIAYACKLALFSKDENHKGYLTFDVMEEDTKNEKKLMQVYSEKYYAQRIGKSTTMIITPEDGEKLMAKYLP